MLISLYKIATKHIRIKFAINNFQSLLVHINNIMEFIMQKSIHHQLYCFSVRTAVVTLQCRTEKINHFCLYSRHIVYCRCFCLTNKQHYSQNDTTPKTTKQTKKILLFIFSLFTFYCFTCFIDSYIRYPILLHKYYHRKSNCYAP